MPTRLDQRDGSHQTAPVVSPSPRPKRVAVTHVLPLHGGVKWVQAPRSWLTLACGHKAERLCTPSKAPKHIKCRVCAVLDVPGPGGLTVAQALAKLVEASGDSADSFNPLPPGGPRTTWRATNVSGPVAGDDEHSPFGAIRSLARELAKYADGDDQYVKLATVAAELRGVA